MTDQTLSDKLRWLQRVTQMASLTELIAKAEDLEADNERLTEGNAIRDACWKAWKEKAESVENQARVLDDCNQSEIRKREKVEAEVKTQLRHRSDDHCAMLKLTEERDGARAERDTLKKQLIEQDAEEYADLVQLGIEREDFKKKAEKAEVDIKELEELLEAKVSQPLKTIEALEAEIETLKTEAGQRLYAGELTVMLVERNKLLGERLAKAQDTIFLLERCLDDYCPQIGLTVSVRQYFYTILGHYPSWIEPPTNMAHFELWKNDVLSKRGEALGMSR